MCSEKLFTTPFLIYYEEWIKKDEEITLKKLQTRKKLFATVFV